MQKKFNLSLNDFRSDIHLVSLARNLRILGNWVNLYRSGKTQYLKKYRKKYMASNIKTCGASSFMGFTRTL
jgi:aminoglycoside/choline kinase family phosphotransferase